MEFDYQSGMKKEWLIANGLGGYASSTAIGANTRKYHGLLVAALKPPAGRRLLVSKLEESVTIDGVPHNLSANKWLDGTIHPVGYEHLEGFAHLPIPTFRYALPMGARLQKEIFMVRGSNVSVARYTVDSNAKTKIEIAPLLNNRNIHSNTHEEIAYEQKAKSSGTTLAFGDGVELSVFSDRAKFEPKRLVFRDMFYDAEAERGQDASDTHVCPGVFSVEIPSGRAVFSIVMSAGPLLEDADSIYGRSLAQADETISKQKDGLAKLLALACDSFIVSGAHGKTIIAGYHWFGEWGRDAMIALPGLTLETGRFGDAKEILKNFVRLARGDGLIPDSRTEGEGRLQYGSADASLWFVNSAYSYVSRTGDEGFARAELWPLIEKLIGSYAKGLPEGTKEDEDGLIAVPSPGRTWMDAFVDGRAVTPRNGKPVEVNALWHNALRIAAEMKKRFERGGGGGDLLEKKAEKTGRSFLDKFWNEKAGCLYDAIEPENGQVRPNQVIALSLPFGPKLPPQYAGKIMDVARDELLTPAGLRSLSFRDPQYRGKYSGPLPERDAAYHQGTVWPWLIGPYFDACRNYGLPYPDIGFLEGFAEECGTIPEIFEGDTLRPDGCISQAWSVAEVLRAHLKTKV